MNSKAKQLPISYYGDPVLRKKAEEITEFNDELRLLAQDMIHTMDLSRGCGLAAPQVGKSLRLFVIRADNEEYDEQNIYRVQPIVFVNPKIKMLTEEVDGLEEGCLSIPGIRGLVWRPIKIQVNYFDLEGKPQEAIFEDFMARVVMHENDHINGVLYIDRMDRKERKALKDRLKELELEYKKKKGK